MNGYWRCEKCNSMSTGEKTRCSFCSAPKPTIMLSEAERKDAEAANVATQIHRQIDKLNPLQLRKVWRYMEDNFL